KDEGSCISCEVLRMVKFERAEDSRIGIGAFLYLSFDDKASLDIEELCRIALSVEVLHGEPSSSLVESRKEGNDGDGVGVREGERFMPCRSRRLRVAETLLPICEDDGSIL